MEATAFSHREDIIQYRGIINLISETVRSIRTQNACLKRDLLDMLLDKLGKIINQLPVSFHEEYSNLITGLYAPIERHDDILTSDYLETVIKPFFNNIIESEVSNADSSIQSIMINHELTIELTSSGDYTMCFRGIYFHSNVSPEDEALQLARFWDEPSEKVCLVWGLGLGYHIQKMLELDPYRKIYVFEPEETVLHACKEYGLYNLILSSERADIIYDPKGSECAKYADKYLNSHLNIHYPTFVAMPEGSLKESFRRFYTAFASSKHQKRSYYMSFRENTALNIKGLNELSFNPDTKRAIIVSAGPSLDKNYLELKNINANSIIIATAPTMRKLYKSGIRPDVVVISDTGALCKKFHEGAEDADCPLVFSSTASVPFVADHKGPRYILCPKGFEPAERLAKENNWPIINSYGSVALTALALAIHKGFKEIVFIGQDLCYKGITLHAEGTSQQYTKNGESIPNAKDIYGDDVFVSNDFALFKSQIETTIKSHPEIRFYNATEGGLHIEGAKNIKLHDIISK